MLRYRVLSIEIKLELQKEVKHLKALVAVAWNPE